MIRALVIAAFLFLVQGTASAQGIFAADSRLAITSTQIVSNTVATVISTAPVILYGVTASNTGSLSPTFVKLYDSAAAVCGSGTPLARYVIPASTIAPLTVEISNGIAFGGGLTMCVTSGYADSDTTAPANSAYIVNLNYKKANQ